MTATSKVDGKIMFFNEESQAWEKMSDLNADVSKKKSFIDKLFIGITYLAFIVGMFFSFSKAPVAAIETYCIAIFLFLINKD